ncbi:MAG: hypothetical protein ACFFD2_10525 [Promethearchaeota archaeon]
MNVTQLLDGKGNLKDTYISCLEEHKVMINGQPFYLIKTFYGTNTRQDFLRTFSNQLDYNLSEKANMIPDKIAYNEYAVLYDSSLKVVAVFNMKFAYYDFVAQKIIFRNPEDILLDFYKGKKFTQKSLDQQLKERIEACQEKVNNKIASLNEQVSAPNPKTVDLNRIPVQSPPNVTDELKQKFSQKKKRRDYMEHAVMYAAAAPVKDS